MTDGVDKFTLKRFFDHLATKVAYKGFEVKQLSYDKEGKAYHVRFVLLDHLAKQAFEVVFYLGESNINEDAVDKTVEFINERVEEMRRKQ